MLRTLIKLKEATLNIGSILHLTNEKSELQSKTPEVGNHRMLRPMEKEIVRLSEERCSADSKCRQNTKNSHHDPSTTNRVITQQVVGTVKWFDIKYGYGFVTRNDAREDIFFRAAIENSKHLGV